MDLNTISQAKAQHVLKKGEYPTNLNLPSCDATKLLNDLIGKGLLPRDVQDEAIAAYAAGEIATLEFFHHATILGMKVTLIQVVS